MFLRTSLGHRRLITAIVMALLLLLALLVPPALSLGQAAVPGGEPLVQAGEADLHLLLYRPGHTNEPVPSDTNITYTISVQNLGPDYADNIIVTFEPFQLFELVSATFGVGHTCDWDYRTVVCELAPEWDGSPGGRVDIEVVGYVDRHYGNQFVFSTADAKSDTVDPDLTNNSATLATWVLPSSDMILTKDLLNEGPVFAGDLLTYNLEVTQFYSPPHPPQDTMVVDKLPEGVTYISSSFAGGQSCTESAGIVTCELSQNPTGIIEILVRVNPDYMGMLTNVATVHISNPDVRPENNSDAHTMLVMPATLDFSMDANGDPIVAGQLIDDEWSAAGIHVTTYFADRHPVMVFDSSNPTGGDPDLGTPNEAFGGPGVGAGGGIGMPGVNDVPLGNLLIISEDGDASDPDDDAHGGSIYFDFDTPQAIYSLQLVDINSWNGLIRVRDINGNWLADYPTMPMGDNSVQTIIIDTNNVGRLEVHIHGSGGLANIIFRN